MNDYLSTAIEIAARGHSGSFDKGGEPYILHPLRVMAAVGEEWPFGADTITAADRAIVYGNLGELRAAAVMHDVLEDTQFTSTDLRTQLIPENVIALVEAVTRSPDVTYREFIEQVAKNKLASYLKLLDLSDNMNPRRARTLRIEAMIKERYAPARERLLAVLKGT